MLGVGLADGAVGLSDSGGYLSADAWTRIDALTDAIASGAIQVPDLPSRAN